MTLYMSLFAEAMATVNFGLCVSTPLINEQQQKSVLFDQATALSATTIERREVLNTEIVIKSP